MTTELRGFGNRRQGPPPEPGQLTRRSMMQLASGAISLAAVPAGSGPAGAGTVADADTGVGVRLTINGARHDLQVDPRQSLLDLLRETLGLTGTKKGCNQGACGACTVLVDGRRIVSCLTLAAMHDGAEITTIEGLERDGRLHPMQEAIIACDGLQCGYCTPGQVISGIACIAEGHAASAEEIRFWMSGNICRCGAYPGIVAAVARAAGRN